ncbi:Odorant receptor 408 [Nylanderia fulva]|uniref:Odorant receptor n=1 Tax=Nylanderia fulva TaxID=613905 RepID=A0A6G1LQ40_9HYME|nr:Odorant receptor 408 [Nylanderia fulva]
MAQKDCWQSRYYAFSKVFMILAGIWSYHTIGIKCLIFVAVFTFSFSIVVPQILLIAPLTLYLLHATDINNIFEGVPSLMIILLTSYQVVFMTIYSEKVRTCFKTMEEDWLLLNTETEKTILQRHTKYGQYLTKVYAIILFLTPLSFILKPTILTIMEKNIENVTMPPLSKLSYQLEYNAKMEQHFYFLMLHSSLAVLSHSLIAVAVDSFYYALIQHACGMFAIIGHVLENIGKNNDANFRLEVQRIDDNNYDAALDCLRRHLHVIEFLFANMFLVCFYSMILSSTVSGIQVMVNLDNGDSIVAPVSFYFAQFLLDYSDIPYKSICKRRWYYTSRRCRKIFLLILSRTMSPCKVTAGNIMLLSIENFGTVLKTSMSYFTVLRSFQN